MLDKSIQQKILRFLYDKWLEDFVHYVDIEDVPFEGVTKESITANAEYLASKGLIQSPRTMRFTTQITIFGIDQIENKRISADISKRIRLLQILKEHFEKEPTRGLSRESLVEITDFTKEDVMRNMWYLGKKGLARVDWALGGYFSARINHRGIDFLKKPSFLEQEQKIMSYAYSIFFLLENKLRIFIESKLTERYKGEIFEKAVLAEIGKKAEKRKSSEQYSELSLFYYMDFRHLKIMINQNWDIFQSTLKHSENLIARLEELEIIRRKIAHCRLLTRDELIKLELFFKEISESIEKQN